MTASAAVSSIFRNAGLHIWHQLARQQMAVAAACARCPYLAPTATRPACAPPAGGACALCWLTWVGTPAGHLLGAGRNKGSSEQQALKSKLAEMRTQFQQLLVSAAPTPCTAASAACGCSQVHCVCSIRGLRTQVRSAGVTAPPAPAPCPAPRSPRSSSCARSWTWPARRVRMRGPP